MYELLKHVQTLMDTNNQSENLFILISQHHVQQKSRCMKSRDILNAAASEYSLDCLALTIGNRHAGDVTSAAKGRESTNKLSPLAWACFSLKSSYTAFCRPPWPRSLTSTWEVYTRRKTNLECVPLRGWMWIRWECSVCGYLCLCVSGSERQRTRWSEGGGRNARW